MDVELNDKPFGIVLNISMDWIEPSTDTIDKSTSLPFMSVSESVKKTPFFSFTIFNTVETESSIHNININVNINIKYYELKELLVYLQFHQWLNLLQ